MNDRHGVRNALLCAFAVAACVLLTQPFVQMGVIDDWSYIKTAQMFAQTGHFVYNEWGAVILGWQVPLGALGIKLFGFSYTAARLYMLPVTAVGAFFFYRVLAGFGLNAANAAFGTLALFLSPLCMPLEFIVMTDIPGLVAVIVCLWMCQKAVLARTSGATIAWLTLAAATNLVGGTPRQIAWLGALVIVPSTAFLLRRRRGVLAAGVALVVATVGGILGILRWFNLHPHVVHEKLVTRQLNLHWLGHLTTQFLRLFLCLLLLLLPLSLAWLALVPRRGRAALVRIALVAAITTAVFAALPHMGGSGDRPVTWLAPFTGDVLETAGMAPPPLAQLLGPAGGFAVWLRVVLSVLTVVAGYAMLAQLVSFARTRRPRDLLATALQPLQESESASGDWLDSWHTIFWLLGPFVAVYLVFLLPRGFGAMLFDRYLMELFAVALLVLLRFYQHTFAPLLPALSLAALAIASLYAVAGTHDLFAMYRARVAVSDEVLAAGVPRTALQGGFDYDGWTQVMDGGNINNDHKGIKVEKVPEECSNWFTASTPSVDPRYFVMRGPLPCFVPSQFPDVAYTAWLPPFHRSLRVGVLSAEYRKVPYILLNQPDAKGDAAE